MRLPFTTAFLLPTGRPRRRGVSVLTASASGAALERGAGFLVLALVLVFFFVAILGLFGPRIYVYQI
jgi:hypothetical protein